jgi:hypothetical protein
VQVDPAELFTSDLPSGLMNRGAFGEISAKLSPLPESAHLDQCTSRCCIASGAGAIGGKIKTSRGTNWGYANQVCCRSQKEKSIGKFVPKFSTIFPAEQVLLRHQFGTGSEFIIYLMRTAPRGKCLLSFWWMVQDDDLAGSISFWLPWIKGH